MGELLKNIKVEHVVNLLNGENGNLIICASALVAGVAVLFDASEKNKMNYRTAENGAGVDSEEENQQE